MPLFAPAVYLLCLLTSVLCSYLLVRSYLRSRSQLLLFSAICFVLLAFNNLFVVIDLLLLPSIDFTIARIVTSLAAVSVLLYGFIWEIDG